MAKRFMPLWFADVIACEEKLARLSEQGLHLTGFSPLTGVFTFEEGEKVREKYRICLAPKCGGNVPKGLINNGWEKIYGGRNMYVVKNPDGEIKNGPSYSSWKTLNRAVIVILTIVFCFYIGMLLGAGMAAVDTGNDVKYFKYIIPLLIIAIPIIVAAIANRRLAKTDTDLGLKKGIIQTIPAENFIYSKEEEKQMLRDGRMMKKAPLGWFYAPDKAEEMVEKYAREGWKFYRFNEMGTQFFFIKSEPCNLKFVVDFQNMADNGYFAAAKDDGWKLEFTSVTRTMSFIIWSKVYEDADDEPLFYTDDETAMKRARRMALSIGLPMMIVVVAAILICVTAVQEAAWGSSFAWFAVIYGLLGVEYGVFGVKAIGYYLRMHKKIKDRTQN